MRNGFIYQLFLPISGYNIVGLSDKKSLYLLILVFVASLWGSGCSISKRVTYEDHEGQISHEFFDAIEEHKTKKSWLVSQLGAPMYVMEGPGSFEVYTYQLSRAKYFHAGVPVVMKVSSVKRKTEYLHIVLERGLVRRAWRDAYSHVQEHALLDALPRKTRNSYLQKQELEQLRHKKQDKMQGKIQNDMLPEDAESMPEAEKEKSNPDDYNETQIPMELPLAMP